MTVIATRDLHKVPAAFEGVTRAANAQISAFILAEIAKPMNGVITTVLDKERHERARRMDLGALVSVAVPNLGRGVNKVETTQRAATFIIGLQSAVGKYVNAAADESVMEVYSEFERKENHEPTVLQGRLSGLLADVKLVAGVLRSDLLVFDERAKLVHDFGELLLIGGTLLSSVNDIASTLCVALREERQQRQMPRFELNLRHIVRA